MPIDAHAIRSYLTKMLSAWDEQGLDRQRGGFYERLDASGAPLDLPYRRTLVQCRQIFTHAHIYQLTRSEAALQGALHGFEFLQNTCRDAEHGGWFFSVSLEGEIHDGTKDAYAHAFVIFACGALLKIENLDEALRVQAEASADEAWSVFDNHLRDKQASGFHEACTRDWQVIERVRRQNPHMHLLEALLMMADASGDAKWIARAKEVLDLLLTVFYDAPSRTLGEFFTADWRPHTEQGEIIEPGHHFEWVWLIGWWLRLSADSRFTTGQPSAQTDRPDAAQPGAHCDSRASELPELAQHLLSFGLATGWDTQHGGVYDEVNRRGEPLKQTKRIWPLTECIKALAWWVGEAPLSPARSAFDEALETLFDRYLKAESGRWIEHLNRDMSVKLSEQPGTTSYHITLGLSEALRLLESSQ